MKRFDVKLFEICMNIFFSSCWVVLPEDADDEGHELAAGDVGGAPPHQHPPRLHQVKRLHPRHLKVVIRFVLMSCLLLSSACREMQESCYNEKLLAGIQ